MQARSPYIHVRINQWRLIESDIERGILNIVCCKQQYAPAVLPRCSKKVNFYLGEVVTNQDGGGEDIANKIEKARTVFRKLNGI